MNKNSRGTATLCPYRPNGRSLPTRCRRGIFEASLNRFSLVFLLAIFFLTACSPYRTTPTIVPWQTLEKAAAQTIEAGMVSLPGDNSPATAAPTSGPTSTASPTPFQPLPPDSASTEAPAATEPVPTPSPTVTFTPLPSPTTVPAPWKLVVGFSVENRPLELYRFGSGPDHRLIIAGIHGGYEVNTIRLAQRLIAYLEEHPEVIPEDVSVFIMPAMNPDGEARHHGVRGRANANGVDLNRNFPVNWQADYPRRGCWNYGPISPGPAPLSEPEASTVAGLLQALQPTVMISYHSAALGIFPGGTPPSEHSVQFAKAIAAVAPYPYPPVDTGCLYTGMLADYADNLGIAALDVELTNHSDVDFDINLRVLKVLLEFEK